MASVNVTINGRQYRMACEDGQEAHLVRLATDFDRRVNELRGKFGEIGDTRLTVMAALMIADEMSEISRKVRRVEEELAALQDARVMSADRDKAREAAVAAALNSAAERIESAAKKLNQSIPTGGPAPLLG
jgi:cell division protein ZapA